MLTRSDLQEAGDTRNTRQVEIEDGAKDEWFMIATQQLRDRTAQEGSFVNRPTRETVERLIDWFHTEDSQVRH